MVGVPRSRMPSGRAGARQDQIQRRPRGSRARVVVLGLPRGATRARGFVRPWRRVRGLRDDLAARSSRTGDAGRRSAWSSAA